MKYIFVDFEMHPIADIYSDKKTVCRDEIIEFGAIMLDEQLIEISSFKSYVKPEYVSNVYTKIAKLTGITYSQLSTAPSFSEVFKEFIYWCHLFEDEIKIYSWSNSDLLQLKKEIELKEFITNKKVVNILNNWYDFQKGYCNIIGTKGLFSLQAALNLAGEYFIGHMHDALYDTRNTSVLFDISKNHEEFIKKIKSNKRKCNVYYNGRACFALVDIFDFSQIKYA